jgi:hypothetical protein
MTMSIPELVEQVRWHGADLLLNDDWTEVVLRPASVPRKLHSVVSRRREEIGAYLVGLKMLEWLRAWEPGPGERVQ